ncbi:FG-GAP-like repeat-containing protein [Candidatus Poribacteria bacterium]
MSFYFSSLPYKVVVGDFNGDSEHDLAVIRWWDSNVAVFLGNGDGTFQAEQVFDVGNRTYHIAVGDFNGDEIQDLVTANSSNDGSDVSVLLGNGDGTFQDYTRFEVEYAPFSVAIGDFNGDGIQDLVTDGHVSISVLLGKGDGTFEDYMYMGLDHYTGSLAVGDFNNDYIQDIASVEGDDDYDDNLSILLGNGDGTFQESMQFDTGLWSHFIAIGDFDGDASSGDPLAAASYESPDGDYSELQKNEDGTFTRTMKDGTQHHFSSAGLHISTVDRNGNTIAYVYGDANGDGRAEELFSITDPVGQVTNFSYDSNGKLSSIIDPVGREIQFAIDINGDLVGITDPDGSTRSFTYDERHLMTGQTKKNGQTTSYLYDEYGRIKETVAPARTVWKDDSLMVEQESRTYNPQDVQGLLNDLPAGTGTPENPAPVVRPEQVRYSMTNGKGIVSVVGQADKHGGMSQETDALGRATNIQRDDQGRPVTITRPNGSVITMAYDSMGNLLTVTEEDIQATTSLTYDTAFNQVTSITEPEGNITQMAYDENGNLINITDALGNVTTMSYDAHGLPVSITDALGNTTTFTYDANGNLISITDPLGRTTTYTYDGAGNVTSITDPGGRNKFFEYDVMNRLTRIIDPAGSPTLFDYDSSGNLVRLTDALGQPTEYQYDELNQPSRMVDPLGNPEQYFYDLNRNLARRIERNGNIFTFQYDDADQLVTELSPDDQVDYAYDLLGNLSSAVDSDSGLGMAYDAIGRLTQVSTLAMSQPATTILYDYDLNSNRIGMVDPQGGLTEYTYDALNRLVSMTNPSSQTTSYAYDALSRRIEASLPNGAEAAYNYDAAGQLLNLSHTAGASLLADYSYIYDIVGNRVSMLELDGVNNYVYDVVDQLVQAVHPQPSNPPEVFTYDVVGNRLSDANSPAILYGGANRIQENAAFLYAFDANGNLIQKVEKSTGDTTDYIYDAMNRLTRIDFPDGGSADYSYDPLGRRIQKNVNGAVTSYVYDSEDVLLDYDGADQVVARYTHGPAIDEPVIVETGGQDYSYHADVLGSVAELTDASGAIAQSYTYDAFGNIVEQAGGLPNRYTYTSREFDSESGLYYYRARYYDSELGRFVSEDPIQSVNLYSYCENNPTLYSDPYGLVKIKIPFIGIEIAEFAAGERFAQEAVDYYASVGADAPWWKQWGAMVGGSLAYLWTPCVSTSTLDTITSVFAGGMLGRFLEARHAQMLYRPFSQIPNGFPGGPTLTTYTNSIHQQATSLESFGQFLGFTDVFTGSTPFHDQIGDW